MDCMNPVAPCDLLVLERAGIALYRSTGLLAAVVLPNEPDPGPPEEVKS